MRPPRNTNRWVWFLNGLLLLALLAFSSVREVYDQFKPGYDYTPEGVDAGAVHSNKDLLRAVRLDPPLQVHGAAVELVPVRYGLDYASRELEPYSLRDAFDIPPPRNRATESELRTGYVTWALVNIVLLDGDGTSKLLLERRALISRVTYPLHDPEGQRPWISYEIAFEDLDADGRLTRDDCRGLFISDVNGGAFRQVVDDEYRVIHHWPAEAGQEIHIYALHAGNADPTTVNWEALMQLALTHDLETGETSLDGGLNEASNEAALLVSP